MLGPMTGQYWTALDADGTTVGTPGPAFTVAQNSSVLAPPSGNDSCTDHAAWNALVCEAVCYRSFIVAYMEPDPTVAVGSYLQLMRTSDQVCHTLAI